MLKQKLDQVRTHLEDETASNDFIRLEKRLESSSLKNKSVKDDDDDKQQNITCLNDFYKKKTFAKALTTKLPSSPFIMSVSNEAIHSSSFNASNNVSQARFIKSNNEAKSSLSSKNWKLILDEEDSSSSNDDEFKLDKDVDDDGGGQFSEDEINTSSKKKRLSMSPLNKIEDTLHWLKHHQSKSSSDGDSFEKKEFSLTGLL